MTLHAQRMDDINFDSYWCFPDKRQSPKRLGIHTANGFPPTRWFSAQQCRVSGSGSMEIPTALQRLGHAPEQRGHVLEALGHQVAHHHGRRALPG